MQSNDYVWTRQDVSEHFLEGVRGAIPLAQAQLEIMLRMIHATQPELKTFLDLGCGDGILGQAVLNDYPDATAVFLDFSAPMLENARKKLGDSPNCVFIQQDYGTPEWVETVKNHAPFDVIVSGFSIHHQPDDRKKGVYQEIYDLLGAGGIFLNLEHVSSPTEWLEAQFDELMIDATFGYAQANNTSETREQFVERHLDRPDKVANILAPVDTQCAWLRDIGFQHVDCYFKLFELALFGGIRPA